MGDTLTGHWFIVGGRKIICFSFTQGRILDWGQGRLLGGDIKGPYLKPGVFGANFFRRFFLRKGFVLKEGFWREFFPFWGNISLSFGGRSPLRPF